LLTVPLEAPHARLTVDAVVLGALKVPGVPGGCVPVPEVVTLTMPEKPELPAELVARTRYLKAVLAARPLSVKDVLVDVPTWAKLVHEAPVHRSIW